MPVTYKDESYNEVMTWTENTEIQYAANKKSGKSFERYGKYMKAKTVGESLSLGSLGADLLFDFEKGLLWRTGGPTRERPPEVKGVDRDEVKSWNKTDQQLGKMYEKWKSWSATFAALEESGLTREELKAANDEQDVECGTDSMLIAIGRRKAQERAREILKAADQQGGRPVTDDELLSCLRLWAFKENTNRTNVTPEGETFVYSDTIGLIKMSTCEKTLLTAGTKRYEEFTMLINRWFKDRMPNELKGSFGYTSININKNYAGRLHRDGNNQGPSMIKAFGEFVGGELNYWPHDDKKLPLEEFDDSKKITMNIQDNIMLFDGNRGHCVNDFHGERYTLVFFSIRTWNKVPAEDLKEALRCGIPVPTQELMPKMQALLGPGPAGYRVWEQRPDGAAPEAPAAAAARAPPAAATATTARAHQQAPAASGRGRGRGRGGRPARGVAASEGGLDEEAAADAGVAGAPGEQEPGAAPSAALAAAAFGAAAPAAAEHGRAAVAAEAEIVDESEAEDDPEADEAIRAFREEAAALRAELGLEPLQAGDEEAGEPGTGIDAKASDGEAPAPSAAPGAEMEAERPAAEATDQEATLPSADAEVEMEVERPTAEASGGGAAPAARAAAEVEVQPPAGEAQAGPRTPPEGGRWVSACAGAGLLVGDEVELSAGALVAPDGAKALGQTAAGEWVFLERLKGDETAEDYRRRATGPRSPGAKRAQTQEATPKATSTKRPARGRALRAATAAKATPTPRARARARGGADTSAQRLETPPKPAAPGRRGLVVGARVQLAGLEQAPELNGATGTIVSFDAKRHRWAVELDGGRGTKHLLKGNLSRTDAPQDEKAAPPSVAFGPFAAAARRGTKRAHGAGAADKAAAAPRKQPRGAARAAAAGRRGAMGTGS